MKDKLIALLKTLGLWKEEDSAKILAGLDALELDKKNDPPPPVDTSKIADPAMKALFEQMQSQVQSLIQVNKELTASLAAEKDARDKAVQAQETQNKTAAEKKVTDAVDAAIKGGKYPEAKRAWLKERFEKDFDGFTDVVKDAPVDKHFKPTNEPKVGADGKPIVETPAYKGPLSGADRTILGKITEMNNAN